MCTTLRPNTRNGSDRPPEQTGRVAAEGSPAQDVSMSSPPPRCNHAAHVRPINSNRVRAFYGKVKNDKRFVLCCRYHHHHYVLLLFGTDVRNHAPGASSAPEEDSRARGAKRRTTTRSDRRDPKPQRGEMGTVQQGQTPPRQSCTREVPAYSAATSARAGVAHIISRGPAKAHVHRQDSRKHLSLR